MPSYAVSLVRWSVFAGGGDSAHAHALDMVHTLNWSARWLRVQMLLSMNWSKMRINGDDSSLPEYTPCGE